MLSAILLSLAVGQSYPSDWPAPAELNHTEWPASWPSPPKLERRYTEEEINRVYTSKFEVPLYLYPDCEGKTPRLKNPPPGFYAPFGLTQPHPLFPDGPNQSMFIYRRPPAIKGKSYWDWVRSNAQQQCKNGVCRLYDR